MMKKRLLNFLPYIVLTLLLLFIVFYIYKYNVIFLDSDASSELVLANLLNKTKSIVTDKWFYSTEIKLINTNLIFAPLFSIFHNWTVIRAIGTGICLLLMIISAIYFYKQLGIKNKALLACMLLVPMSIQYFGMYMGQPSYEFSSIKTFITLGLLLDIIKKNDVKKYKYILLAVVSFIQGLDGLRNVAITVIPIIIAYLVLELLKYYGKLSEDYNDTLKKYKKVSIVLLISCLIGFLFNILVLSKMFSFISFGDMSFITMGGESLSSLIGGWLRSFGYVEGKALSLNLLHNGLALLIFVALICTIINNLKRINNINKEETIFTLILTISLLILAMLTLFVHFINSDMERYNLPVAILAFPLLFIWFENNTTIKNITKYVLIGMLVLYFACGLHNLLIYRNNENRSIFKGINSGRTNYDSVELNDIVYRLETSGYKNGYAYFWNGNIITELSNGNIEMWVWGNGGDTTTELKDISEVFKWLQLKDHKIRKPTGKVFVILTPEELDYSKIAEKLEWSDVIYNSSNYIVYGYQSNEELIKDFNN